MSGPECCSNPPTFNPSAGAGRVEKVGGVDTYVSGSADFKLAILLISDVFGYEAPNLRKLADKVAAAGYFVVVPDFIHGDPFDAKKADRPLSVWVKDHSPDKGVEVAKPVIEALKGIEIPIAILGAGTDRISPPELVKQFEQILSAKPGVHSFVKIFPQVVHGWAVRYNTEDAKAVSAAEEAHQDLLSWFAKHVKYPRSRY
ncbi:endo-1,3;1,4-beta-D-glucanase-like isoform X6 [Prosopis cineraria]|uniref:endo-1,3;1,4-beta-D-glucanase-like isoform X6 n=1 Tax=Prosopis cineraria TaxID=364024 RepID=UPI0024109D1B|nr:endo-1,3;1,4-beta-D-glucanase-like isoform X6 [Prosopis cineraria]